ncbi:DUF2264 domain-containing protein [Microbacterium aurantiacum]|uniref:DUF2264 domain-containing protein n=2 Tax=Microbacterium aurantiacum TaxID=162393 RepID=A0AAJ2LY14_9MICO|nr:DUF2264 domain-containing protein [Microbacterium aurantiacum]MDS0244948.1 DUF2264 domain-containing protein [Microbacterium aurantiacum]
MPVPSHPTAAIPSVSPRERADAAWTRDHWLALADRLLTAARGFASPGGARITYPGAEGGYGADVDGLEGFARTFLLAAFRIAGSRGIGTEDLAEDFRRGIVAGVDPLAPDRWVRLDEHAQAKVEAASLALGLDMTRPWIWDRLDQATQARVIAYLAPVVGDDTYPRTNWLWFRVVVQTFLRSVGGPWSEADIAADLALHDSLVREDGWISDGIERSYDHYVGWALHVYPMLWSRMQGAMDLAAPRHDADVARLDRFLQDAVHLVGGDGSPLIQGRSLIYRFAAAAPFWAGVLAEVPSVPLGRLRGAATAVVSHFVEHGVPNAEGVLDLGWHGPWRALAQSYSGPGSPYWAVKGLLGILLPGDHPVWAAPVEPLPIAQADELRAVRAAGWIVSATREDGIVRVINHGTDHAPEGALVGDSPLYARIGYSTTTSPLLDERAWEDPVEQSVTLVDRRGRATHRAAMQLLGVEVQGHGDARVGVASSLCRPHWITPVRSAAQHGSGLAGAVEVAGTMLVHSIVRGPWEVRLVRLTEPAATTEPRQLRIGGWALAADAVEQALLPAGADAGSGAWAFAGDRRSGIRALSDGAVPAFDVRADASPLGPEAVVPTLTFAARAEHWYAVLIELTGRSSRSWGTVGSAVVDDAQTSVAVTWPDGTATTSRLTHPGVAPPANR